MSLSAAPFTPFTAVLAPFESAVSSVLAAAHTALTSLGLAPGSGLAWVAAVVVLVAVVRAVTLPLVVHQIRSGRALARARPHLSALAQRYRGRTDVDSMRAYRAEMLAVRREHGAGGLGCLPLLLQIPVMFALYRVLLAVSHHESVGAMTPDLVRLADAARLGGVSLGDTVTAALAGGRPGTLAAMAALVVAAAALTYVTQRFFVLPGLNLADAPESMAAVQRMLPAVSALGIVVGAGAVPAGILVYWVATNAWSLAQQAGINRWAPTPGSPAEAVRARRLGTA
ncbi:membrane protein insertase YidC [Agilicoccus flavus]|uniref:membrane protein insertase YidC n=1 Tax=Agilicoccus flavus TaxID=2775968 RepID=UPI001CF6D23E|nr:membrane protein insertase YidC [Agilicoccus flavus]